MNENFLENWINREHCVLGRRLHPFCLYDALALAHLDSPFLDLDRAAQDDRQVEYADLRWAVKVCSSKPGAALGLDFYRPAPIREILGGLRFRLRPSQLRCSWMSTELRFKRECDLFAEYIDDFFRPPQTWSKSEAAESGAPWPLAIASHLGRNLAHSLDFIWCMPLGQALWYSVMMGIQDGSEAQFLTEEEDKFLREAGLL